MMNNDGKKILGIMSGTSLDGLDFALCRFKKSNDKFEYDILTRSSCPYID